MCGEHTAGVETLRDEPGSSPHVRGAQCPLPLLTVVEGIIPACAGSTVNLANSRVKTRDHPRMCGEHECDGDAIGADEGSSPHVRGARY